MIDAAQTAVKLTANERRVLAEFKKSKIDWAKVHGRTRDALQRKKLLKGHKLTAAGRAELEIPDVFADLFDKVAKEPAVPKKPQKKQAKAPEEFRPIEYVETTLHDPVRDRWEEGTIMGGVRLYCTADPFTHGIDNARWALQVRARVKTQKGEGKHIAIGTASMSREALLWLRDLINVALRAKARKVSPR
jgi:hypothetical protein